MVRQKKRYIVVQVVPEAGRQKLRIKDQVLTKCVLTHLRKFYGDYGLGVLETGFRVKYCNDRTKIAIIRCAHASHELVTSMLPLITLIGDVRAKFRILYVGATIMKSNKFIVAHQQRYLLRHASSISSAAERKQLEEAVMNFEMGD